MKTKAPVTARQVEKSGDFFQKKPASPFFSKKNHTGMPDDLKAGIEQVSGMEMNDVKVRYNSPEPAKIQAHAYAQGTDIHLGPGKEKYLPHEAWHVVQQKRGQVKPTAQLKGEVSINDNPGLENEADKWGDAAATTGKNLLGDIQAGLSPAHAFSPRKSVIQSKVIQRAVGFELEVNIPVSQQVPPHDLNPPDTRDANADWINAQYAFPEAEPHADPPVPQTVIYHANHGGQVVDAVPDKRRLAPRMPRQILEIRVNPVDTHNIAGLAATMAHIRSGIDPLYNGIHAGNPANNRFVIPPGTAMTPAMAGLPHGHDPMGEFDDADRARVTWTTYMQATAGIRTDRLNRLSQKIRHGAQAGDDPSYNSLQSPYGFHRQIAEQAQGDGVFVYNTLHAVHPNPDDAVAASREAAIGFFTLICMYLRGGGIAYEGQGNLNPKNMAPLFSRSGFNQIRSQTLSANAQNWIIANKIQLRQMMVQRTRSANPNHEDGLKGDLFNRLDMANPTRTVEIFLNDALGRNEDRYTGDEAKSIIAPENVGQPTPGGVLEFRKIANPGNTPAAWVAKMTEVVTAIHHMNA
ncbi:MAG: DUF4157 domain-containing protein [Bacteroidia bacterium]